MKLTKNSELLLSFFIKKKCIKNINQSTKTNSIIKKLYKEIKDAYNYVNNIKSIKYYDVSIKTINDEKSIPMSKNFNEKSFPVKVVNHIKTHSKTQILYTFSLFERKIKVNFIEENSVSEGKIQIYNKYLESIIMWLYIAIGQAEKNCAKELEIFLYFTSLKKNLPDTNMNILSEINVNTAFTTTCPVVSEIVVYRKEEWFKVLIHESMHNFALDFSDMNMINCHKKILELFPVNSEVNLYESYTELWAEIMNAMFCSFFILKNKNDVDEFLINSEFFLNFERNYSFFQMTKALEFMGMKYRDLYSKNSTSDLIRKELYKEKSNVLSYYIIKTILLNNYPEFLKWCNTNNHSLLQFKKTEKNLSEYCELIEKGYKSKSMLEGVQCAEKYLKIYKNKNLSKPELDNSMEYLLNNMRMSICELG